MALLVITFLNNVAKGAKGGEGSGGAIYSESNNEISIAGCMFAYNVADKGGAVYLSREHRKFSITSLEEYQSFQIASSAHPYNSETSQNGDTGTQYEFTIADPEATDYLIYFNPQTRIYDSEQVTITTTPAGFNAEYTGTAFPGIKYPMLKVNSNDITIRLLNQRFFPGLPPVFYGYEAYFYPIHKSPATPTKFVSNSAKGKHNESDHIAKRKHQY